MSLLSPADWQLFLAPGQVRLACTRRHWSRRGWRAVPAPQATLACEAGAGGESWEAALAALGAWLRQNAPGAAGARVIVSNRLVRYALLPPSAALADDAEDAAYAVHHFRELYGMRADGWNVAIAPAGHAQPRVASAIDAALLAALEQVLAGAGLRLRSVTPQLMDTFNRHRARFGAAGGWLVAHESGCLCLALLAQRRWMSVRSYRAGPGWRAQLGMLLERESCMADVAPEADVAYLWDAEPGPVLPVDTGRWRLERLGQAA